MSDAGYEREKVRIESAHIGVFVGISGSETWQSKRENGESSRRPDASCGVRHRETQDWRDVCKAPSANGVPETFIARLGFGYATQSRPTWFIAARERERERETDRERERERETERERELCTFVLQLTLCCVVLGEVSRSPQGRFPVQPSPSERERERERERGGPIR